MTRTIPRLAFPLTLADIRSGLGFVIQLRIFLRQRVPHPAAIQVVQHRLRNRGVDFVQLMRDAVFANPTHPYSRLFQHAGCTASDLTELVERLGLEGALGDLVGRGIYLTGDEAKGRAPVVRGSLRFTIEPGSLANKLTRSDLRSETSGSTGAATPVFVDLRALSEATSSYRLGLDARGGADWAKAIWGTPGAVGLMGVLWNHIAFSRPPEHWFSATDPRAADIHPRIRHASRLVTAFCRMIGVRAPTPTHAPIDAPQAILDWIAGSLTSGGTPHLATTPGLALRLVAAAAAAGVDIRGLQVTLRGEAVTLARLATLREAGVSVGHTYGATECGGVGHSCVNPIDSDDVHLLEDLHAIIQPGSRPIPGLPADALLVTSIRRTSRLVLVNASLGDSAVISRRRCGCPLEEYGLTTHLHSIRSFEKLNGVGMTFHGSDVIRVLEVLLPQAFGGAGANYQLVEAERSDGASELRLVIDPAMGEIDEPKAIAVLLDGLAGQGEAQRMMSNVWRDANLVTVVRAKPTMEPSGKVPHLRVLR